jgi:hypothetical protein
MYRVRSGWVVAVRIEWPCTRGLCFGFGAIGYGFPNLDSREEKMISALRWFWNARILWCGLAMAVAITSPATAQRTISVNCGAGHTIAAALANPARSLIITVHGSCSENVTIARDDVTLQGVAGATVSGPDVTKNTITVAGARVVISTLTVMGGRNGIVGFGSTLLDVRDCTVRNTNGFGIAFQQATNGTVDGSTIQANPLSGISIESGSATITNSTIRDNGQWGIIASNGASGRIGLTDLGKAAGNTISDNGVWGVLISIGAVAFVGGNTISGNGTDQHSANRSGITVVDSVADITGGNKITNNPGGGILVHASKVTIGDPTFGTSVNTISANGSQIGQANFPFANGGVFAYVNSALDISNAIISGNTGSGVALLFRSNATITAGKISGNTQDGVQLETGSAVIFQLFQSVPAAVSGNSVADLGCDGTDTRYAGFGANALTGIGTIQNCPPAGF